MEHIVQFAINIDDQTIKKRLEENAYQDICDRLVNEAYNYLGRGTRTARPRWDIIVDEAIDRFVEAHKNEVIDVAAEKLKESYFRTKAYKEKMKDVLDE